MDLQPLVPPLGLWVAILAAAGVALAVAAVVSARPPAVPIPGRSGYFERWQRLHAGYDPRTGSVWVRGWLTIVYRVALPLARRGVHPDTLTLATVVLAGAVTAAAAAGGRWAIVGAVLLVISGLGDSLDGAVAVLTGRTSAWGYVLDSVTDRINDVLYVVALVVVGAPAWLAAGSGMTFFLLEYMRARAGSAGHGDVAVVTWGERPNRVAFCAAGLLCAGVFPTDAATLAGAALGLLTALSLIGLMQLTVAVRRHLSAGDPDEIGHDRS